jgi:hypothetical protein
VEIILAILIVVALAAAAFFAIKAQSAGSALERANAMNAGLGSQLASLQVQVQHLSRYQTVVDAEAAATAVRAQAEAGAAQTTQIARRDAERIAAEGQTAYSNAQTAAAQVRAQSEAAAAELAANARREADRMLAEARTASAQAQASVQASLAQAAAESAHIVDEAKRHAEEIAGGALTAMRDAKLYEQTAQAMKNVIKGYGDQYVIPTAGLLDDLAEEFGFAEAGQRLKVAREKVRSMIKQGTAATCDYVEANRRTTAIEFVLDAFNGKVDMILADVRHDNFGTLQRKIQDAFTLVNHNGRAFRDARILPEYLDARLDELRWAVVAHELKLKEREEQRLIKERIREEERAQREFEKAMKEAEKEQDVLRKAMEKAQRDVAKSTDAERAMYEQKLRELTERLRLAEEKNQKAISMAQQTKSGHVYIISNVGSFGEDVYKIGMTRRLEPLDRVRELGDASVPFEFDVHAMIPSRDAPALERTLHQRFVLTQVNKVNPRKEFFRIPLHKIREEIERMAVEVTWTLAAEAREFRETQAIERAIKEHTFDETAWLQAQMKAETAPLRERDLAEATE